MTRSRIEGSYLGWPVTRQQSPSSLQTMAPDAAPALTASAAAAARKVLERADIATSLVARGKRLRRCLVRIEATKACERGLSHRSRRCKRGEPLRRRETFSSISLALVV